MLKLIIFAFLTAITPGPANIFVLMLGQQKNVKELFKCCFAFMAIYFTILYTVGIGIGAFIIHHKIFFLLIKITCTVVLLHFIFSSLKKNQFNIGENTKILKKTFMGYILFQMSNPKIWTSAIIINSLFLSATKNNTLLLSFLVLLTSIPSYYIWFSAGKFIGKLSKKKLPILRIIHYILMLSLFIIVLLIWIK